MDKHDLIGSRCSIQGDSVSRGWEVIAAGSTQDHQTYYLIRRMSDGLTKMRPAISLLHCY